MHLSGVSRILVRVACPGSAVQGSKNRGVKTVIFTAISVAKETGVFERRLDLRVSGS